MCERELVPKLFHLPHSHIHLESSANRPAHIYTSQLMVVRHGGLLVAPPNTTSMLRNSFVLLFLAAEASYQIN